MPLGMDSQVYFMLARLMCSEPAVRSHLSVGEPAPRSEVEVKRKFANDPAIYDSWTVGPVLRLWMTGACTIAQF